MADRGFHTFERQGRWRWEIIGPDAVLMARSIRTFDDEEQARENARATYGELGSWLYEELEDEVRERLKPFEGQPVTEELKPKIAEALRGLKSLDPVPRAESSTG